MVGRGNGTSKPHSVVERRSEEMEVFMMNRSDWEEEGHTVQCGHDLVTTIAICGQGGPFPAAAVLER